METEPEPTDERPETETTSSEDDASPAAERRPKKRRKRRKKPPTFRPPRGLVVALGVALLLALLLVAGARFTSGLTEPLSLNIYKDYLDRNEIAKITFKENEARITLRPGDLTGRPVNLDRRVKFVNNEHARTEAERLTVLSKRESDPLGVAIHAEHGSPFLQQFLPSLLMMAIVIGAVYFLLFRTPRNPGAPGSVFNFGKSRARMQSKDRSTGVTFADVAGAEEAKEEVSEIVEFLKNPEKFRRLGGRIPKGIMLVGAPGAGKTLLAKAISGEADVPFFSVCGSDFVEMFVGVGAARVRDLFKQARENSPCIIFLDEIDAVGRRRGTGLGGGHDEREQTLNQILVEMDGFDTDQGIIMLASTNRPDILDPALLRPGRFDRQIVIDMPDVRGREAILGVHSARVKLGPDVDMAVIARATPGFTGAELEALINEAAIIAAMKDADAVALEDLEEARDKIRWGRQKTSRVIDEEDRRATAYHEAGHALVSALLPECEPLHKVTIVPRGVALGATMTLPERDRTSLAKKRVLGTIAMCFGGRIGEQVITGDLSTGASNDIEKATDLARRMVCEWGMSDALGPIRFSENEETLFLGREVSRTQSHSEHTAQLIDKEIRVILDAAYKRAEKLVGKNRIGLDRISEALLRYETVTGEEVERLMNGTGVAELRGNEAETSEEPEPQAKRSSGSWKSIFGGSG